MKQLFFSSTLALNFNHLIAKAVNTAYMFGQISKIIFVFVLLFFYQMVNAQQGEVNPFELPDRIALLDSMLTTSDSMLFDSILAENNNPFDVFNFEKNTTTPIAPEIRETQDSEPIPNIWMGGIILVLGVLMAILNTAHSTDLQRTFRSFTNQNILNFNFRSQKSRITTMYIIAYILYAISVGSFLYLLGWYFGVPVMTSSIYSALICMAFVAVVIFGKHALLHIIGWIMPFDKELSMYNHIIAIFNQVLGIALLPFIVVAAFAPDPFKKIALFGGLGLILLVYLYRSIRGFLISGKFLTVHKFHFFLYLCAVEIAPVLILVKVLSLST